MFLFKNTKNEVNNNLKTITEKIEYKGIQYPQSNNEMNCEMCGKPLRAFHYYRDNFCSTYCEKCGKPYQSTRAAPYRTVELIFSGIQREGFSLTIEIKSWPSLKCSSFRWYEWAFGGGYVEELDLTSNYMLEHTVDEFIDEYILKENKVIKHIPDSHSEDFLKSTRTTLIESGVFQK